MEDPVDDKKPRLNVEVTYDKNGVKKTNLRATKTSWIEKLIYLDGKPFSFAGREYLKTIYNSAHPKKLLICGRQVEKCQKNQQPICLENGSEKQICELRAGDLVVAMNAQGHRTVDRVLASESNGDRPCLKIKTRLGSTLEVTHNHPLRKLLGWAVAGDLTVGDRIAALRTVGEFGEIQEPLAPLIGLLFGDGCFSSDGSVHQRQVGFTNKNPAIQDWFVTACVMTGHKEPRSFISKTSGSTQYSIGVRTPIGQWLERHNLYGMRSSTKVLPDEVFHYGRESARDLLRGLWATDGHCKNVHSSKVDLVYCTTSEELARQVRLLLRKFGVVTVQRSYQPKRGELAYIVRVVTRKSIEAFHREIGPIPGKPFDIPDVASNSNLDTVPKDVYPLVEQAKLAAGYTGKRGAGSFDQQAGFRFKSVYAPTFEKLSAANEILNDEGIRTVLDSDIIWDEIVSIEDIGVQPTWSIQTETETYLSDFVVQHNSTMLANEIIIGSVLTPYRRTLYISPSHSQTRQFSNGKLKPWIHDSPVIKKYMVNSATSDQVFERGFTNGSMCFLRSAFLTADRARGLSADLLALDEMQDLLTSNIPVIEECLSHAPNPQEIMSGTPKSLANPIEVAWQGSSMCEWLVPCDRHAPIHWNYLDSKNIGKTGLICNKCGNPIDPATGKWVAFNETRDIMGYRISQLMVPWFGNQSKWQELIWKLENYGKAQFHNEVLGLSYDSSSKPISRVELLTCCTDKYPMRMRPDNFTRRIEIFAGVDWGEGSDGTERGEKGKIKNASYTILTLGTYIDPNHFHIFYFRRFTGKEALPGYCINEIINTLRDFNVKMVGVDWGHGWGVNERLEDVLGTRRVVKFQHVGSQRDRMKYDDIGHKYQLSRNEVMTEFFLNLKDAKIVFPPWEQVKDFLCDYEHIFAEYRESSRTLVYDHRSSEPDDAFHSSLYCLEVANLYYQRKL